MLCLGNISRCLWVRGRLLEFKLAWRKETIQNLNWPIAYNNTYSIVIQVWNIVTSANVGAHRCTSVYATLSVPSYLHKLFGQKPFSKYSQTKHNIIMCVRFPYTLSNPATNWRVWQCSENLNWKQQIKTCLL